MVTYIAMYPLCETLRGIAGGIILLSLFQHFVATNAELRRVLFACSKYRRPMGFLATLPR